MEVKETFRRKFLEKDLPTNRTIWKNVKKYERERISLNTNMGRSARSRTVRIKETIEVVRLHEENNARNVSWTWSKSQYI